MGYSILCQLHYGVSLSKQWCADAEKWGSHGRSGRPYATGPGAKGRRATSGWLLLLHLCNLGRQSICTVCMQHSLVPRPPPFFCPLVCVQYNTRKSDKKTGKAWEHLSCELRLVDARWT